MSAIVGGTALELGGGKFANGAVTGAFVMMYNEMAHESRQEIVLKRARNLLENPRVSEKYKRILTKLLNSKSVLYVDKLVTTASSGNKQVKDEFFGVTAEDFSYIKIGGKSFTYWTSHGNIKMIGYQLDHTILHEVRHVLIQNNGHYEGFDKEIGDMGFGYGY